MDNERPESKTLEEVRRWRKEAYEARQKMTFEEQERHDREVAERLGLSHLPMSPSPKRTAPSSLPPAKKAG